MGVKVKVLLAFNVPEASYQLADSPVPTVTVKAGIVVPAQMVLSPPLTGGVTVGQAQLGAVTAKSSVHVPKVAVKVTFVPLVMPDTVLLVLSTVPAVLVTVPELEKVMVYVFKSNEQTALATVRVGLGFTVTTLTTVPTQPDAVVQVAV